MPKLFRYYDRDNSGEMEFDEFRRAVRRDAKLTVSDISDDGLRKIFDKADTDGGGTISLEEFTELLLGSSTLSPTLDTS